MGRTFRRRKNKKPLHRPQLLDHEETNINLRKFMTRNGFNDEINLKLRNFPTTGRGVASVKSLYENDILITVPFDLMITYSTLKSVNFLNTFNPAGRLTIHDLLTTFLVLEKHKNSSFWRDYINSLPQEAPWLPLTLSEEHIELLPLEMRLEAKKTRRLLEESWSRVNGSIKTDWTCSCCGESCVFDFHLYTWGYILVNTRSVYVNPQVIRELCDCSDILSDEPCMALCPFLDMFNHNDKAKTQADVISFEGKLVYQLRTLTSYEKHEQIFISYGEHDNTKLLIEYGFFIPGNCYDYISFPSEEVVRALQLNIADLCYKFISKHGLDKSLTFSEFGPSFNLKGFLFAALSDESEVKNFAAVVFSDNYPEDFLKKKFKDMCHKLLRRQLLIVDGDWRSSNNLILNVSLIMDFLKYRQSFVEELCKKFC